MPSRRPSVRRRRLPAPAVSHRSPTVRSAARAIERGQSTVEYALVLVAVTVFVGVVIAYLTGDGASSITGLFDSAFDRMRSLVDR